MSSPRSNENLLQRKYMFLEESIERNAETLFILVQVSKMPSKLLQLVDRFPYIIQSNITLDQLSNKILLNHIYTLNQQKTKAEKEKHNNLRLDMNK